MQIDNLARDAETFTANVFLIDDTALIDAGKDPSIVEKLREKPVETVVITHSHYDHVDNLNAINGSHDTNIYAYEPDNLPVPAEKLRDGDTIDLAGVTFQVFHTPGHKDDSICLYAAEEKLLFAGDLLFPDGGFGRTDLEEGDRDQLIESIERIAALDVQAMYSGHGDPTDTDVNQQIQQSLEKAREHEPKY